MDLQELKDLRADVKSIRNIEDTVKKLKSTPNCDKLAFGFNVDSRFKGCKGIEVYLGGYKGFYGSSDVSSIFSINDERAFNNALVETLNDLRLTILNGIANKLQETLGKSADVISADIARLQAIYDEIKPTDTDDDYDDDDDDDTYDEHDQPSEKK